MNIRAIPALTLMLILAACSGNKAVRSASGTDTVPVAATTATPVNDANAAGAAGARAGTAANAGDTSTAGVAALAPIIYFDFDSSEIRAEYLALLTEQVRALTRSASVRLRLEGHTDERGSREYNIGLGERRAQAVRHALLLQGVGESQVSTLSFGEERPAVAGSAEEDYAKNRRVELVYGN